MKRHFFLICLAVVFFLCFPLFLKNAHSEDQYDLLGKEIAELEKALEMSKNATTPLEGRVSSLKHQINGIEFKVETIEEDLKNKRKNIDKGYKNLAKEQETFNLTVRNHYIKSYYFNPLVSFFSSDDAENIIRFLVYQKRSAEQDKATITNIALTIEDLEEKKKTLESEEKKLSQIKITFAKEKAELDKVVKGAKEYQASLSTKIAELTAKQQEILSARSGSFTVSIGDSELADDYNASIKGFREAAPSGYFAIFSFGAHTHRKGMSQYGARGRAQNGQSYRDILRAYYGKEPEKDEGATTGTINVEGFSPLDFETTYLYGIAEMPSAWHKEALKAQAVAARTYALRYKQQGSTICTDEGCQVFSMSKSNNVPESWKQAVDETKGEVLRDVTTYYASTHGGYTTTTGWDTTDGGGGGNFIDKAYDKIGGSPWVYKSWYTKAYSPNSDKCGRSNPWLNPEEMADIVNAAIALKTGGIDTGRITPVTTSCWGGNPYSMEELRNLVSSHGGISQATSVSVSQGNGKTINVNINGISLGGDEFCNAFNVRAPGYLQIPQWSGSPCQGAFFNIEKK